MAKVEFIHKNYAHSAAYRWLRQLKSMATILQSTLHTLKEAEGAYYSAHWPMDDLRDQKFDVRYELEKVNKDIRTLKNSIKQSSREYEKQWLKYLLRGHGVI